MRVFRSHFDGVSDTLAIVEFDRPPDAMSLHSAFGEVADVQGGAKSGHGAAEI
jgi:hypothetical protein